MPCIKHQSAWLLLSAIERLAALCGLLLLAPLLLAVALATVILSRKSPLIAHRRLGLRGRPFWVLKFRTMWRRGNPRFGGFTLVEYIVDESGPREKGAQDHLNQTPTVIIVTPDGKRRKLDGVPPFNVLSAYLDELLSARKPAGSLP